MTKANRHLLISIGVRKRMSNRSCKVFHGAFSLLFSCGRINTALKAMRIYCTLTTTIRIANICISSQLIVNDWISNSFENAIVFSSRLCVTYSDGSAGQQVCNASIAHDTNHSVDSIDFVSFFCNVWSWNRKLFRNDIFTSMTLDGLNAAVPLLWSHDWKKEISTVLSTQKKL